MSIKYLNISEKDFSASKCIQKFLPLERALQLLDTKKLWFSNPAKWPDPVVSLTEFIGTLANFRGIM